MKATITALLVRKRVIHLPDVCPTCGVNFSVAEAAISRKDLRPWSYDGKNMEGKFKLRDTSHKESEDEDGSTEAIEGLEYFCNACNTSLARGHFSNTRSGEPPAVGDEESKTA